jgi:amino acid adenylation domain-containing protein
MSPGTSHQAPLAVLECPAPYERDRTLLDAYLASAAAHAGNPAVVAGAVTLTYADLTTRAGGLADALRERGVRRGDSVGLLLARGVDVPVALLAVLLCGGVFVPLEPDAPPEWNARIVQRARCRVVVTNGPPVPPGVPVVDCAELGEAGAAPEAPAREPTDPVSVMFTSGSTGEPKGVLIPNRAIVRLCRGNWFADTGPGCRFLHASPLAFDASTLEIWSPLLNGGTVVIAPPGGLGIGELARLIAEQRVTSCWLTASLFHACVQARPQMFDPLRAVLTGGDVVSPKWAAALRARCPGLRLTNGYGPTENTTFTTCHEVREVDPDRPLPIGRPIANTGVCVVNERLEPLGADEPGELVATGDGLALGYLDDPEATSAAFVELPGLGRRGYRTGDRALMRPDGTVEYLGRMDRQVKIRGFRVNPATTEAALQRQPGVREAAVVVARHADGPALCAVVSVDPTDSWPDLRARLLATLRAELPEYLMPQSLAHRDELPRSQTEKLDRNAIRAELETGVPIADAWRARLQTGAAGPGVALGLAAAILQAAWAPGEGPGVTLEAGGRSWRVDLPPIGEMTAREVVAAIEGALPADLAGAEHATAILRDPEGREARLLDRGELRLALHADTTGRVRDWRVQHARAVLRFLAEAPGATVASLTVLGDDERRQVEQVWNDTGWDHGLTEPLSVMFERHAAAHADHEALRSDDLAMSFGQVLRRSNAVANRILREGAGPGSRVAFYDSRTVDTIITALGILRAGAVCVPLDTRAPQARTDAMVEDAGVAMFLRGDRDGPAPTLPAGVRSIEFRHHEDPTPPSGGASIEGDAYILFTSGSTGRPKAVPVRHESLVNRIAWMHRRYGLMREDIVLQRNRLFWDVSIWEYLWPLAYGGRCFVADASVGDPARLHACVLENEITVMHLVPTLVGPFARAARRFGRPRVRCTICSGEPLSDAAVREHLEAVGGEVHNLYGPTEAAIDVTCTRCDDPSAGVTIGRPVENTRITIVDQAGRPVPVGVPGEIRLSGVQVSRGYLGQAGRGSDAFLTGEDGGPVYRTGDSGRWREDGCVEFLGRADSQVKLCGFRIELGEVEAALLRRDEIAEAVVCKVGDGLTASLVAVCVPDDRYPEHDSQAVLAALRETLDDVMVPGRVEWRDAIPRLPNGKVDRRTLTASIQHGVESGSAAQSPREVVRSVWRSVVGVAPASDTANFMAEGGNSLSFLRLMLGVEERLGIEIPAAPALSEPTLGRVTALVESLLHSARPGAGTARHPEGEPRSAAGSLVRITYGDLPLVMLPHLGGTMGYLREIAPHLQGHLSIYGIRPRGLFDGEAPLDTIEAIAEGYAELVAQRGWPAAAIAGFSSGAIIGVDMARRLRARGVRVPLLVLVDSGPRVTAEGRLRRAAGDLAHTLPRLLGKGGRKRGYGEHVTETQKLLMDTHLTAVHRHSLPAYDGAALVIASREVGNQHRLRAWRRVLVGPADEVLVEASHMAMWRGDHAQRMSGLLLERVTAAFERDAAPIARSA